VTKSVNCSNVLTEGYLYAYLSSRIGKALVSKDHYGGVVDHIEAHHVKEIPVHDIGADRMVRINEKIVKVWKPREEALELENEAIRDLEILLEKSNTLKTS
jgi:type I restriction enzyme, S subunit